MLVATDVVTKDALYLCEEEGATCPSESELRALELEVEQQKLKDREQERRFQLAMLEKKSELGLIGEQAFDVTKCCTFVPVFDELDAEEYFLQFENVATSLLWPRRYWPIIAQTSFKGKGLSTYLSLTADQQKDYSIVKKSILKAYQSTPEFYQSKFRNSAKAPGQTFVEYAHLLRKLHNRWIASRGVTDFDQLCELMVLEQYLNTLPYDIKIYLCEKEVDSLDRAAFLAENYDLIHKANRKSFPDQNTTRIGKPLGTENAGKSMNSSNFDTRTCNYCKKPGHFVASCPKLERKEQYRPDTKPVNNYVFKPTDMSDPVLATSNECQQLFQPFRFKGSVSASEDSPSIPVNILRDTGASHSIVVRSIVPFVEDAYTGEFVVLKGINGCITLPLCKLYLRSGIISQAVTVAVQDSLPVEGVTFLLGNDIAGCRVIPDPVVCSNPLNFDPAVKLTEQNPGLFPSCVVTRSQSKDAARGTGIDLDNLDKLFDNETIHDEIVEEPLNISNGDFKSSVDIGDVPVTRKMLVEAQRADPSLGNLYEGGAVFLSSRFL